MNPTTLSDALRLVPEYILMPLPCWPVDGDEYLDYTGDSPVWRETKYRGAVINICRRHIPQDVREAMAKLIVSDLPYNGVVRPFESWLIKGGDK